MRFIERDFTNQKISSSYQDVVQQYVATGSTLYLLDGKGNAIFSIPSASYGQSVITADQTISSASYAGVSSTADYAELSGTSSLSVHSDFSISSSWASASISSSYSPIPQNLSFNILTASIVKSNGNIRGIRMVSSSSLLTNTDYTILCSGSFSVFLPEVVPDGTLYVIKKIDDSGSIVITGSATIDTAQSMSIVTKFVAFTLQSYGGNWYII